MSQTVIKSLAPPILSYIVQSEKPVLKTSEINIHTEAAKLLECLVLVCDEAHCESYYVHMFNVNKRYINSNRLYYCVTCHLI